MEFNAQRDAALHQLAAVPGVVGSLVFDRRGAVRASVFPDVFDAAGLDQLASQLAADGYFQEWVAGDQGALTLSYQDGSVALRALGEAWLLVLSTSQANPQLLAMSLTQVVRRLRLVVDAPPPREPLSPPAPRPADRIITVARAELGALATQAIEILAAAGQSRKELLAAIEEVERMVRLFIDKKQAERVSRKLRDALGN